MTSVLIVDDDTVFRSLICRDLVEQGFSVSLAQSAEEAMPMLSGGGIDVLLTDYRMPGADGIDLIHAVRKVSPRTRALLMSGFAGARDYQRAIECGAVRVLCKPFTSAELLQSIRQAVDSEHGFRGSIHGLSLIDLLQMFHFAGRSVAIVVDGWAPGHVFLEGGRIIHAAYRELAGEPALRAIVSMPAGSLRTMVLPAATPHTISADFQELMLALLESLEADDPSRPVEPSSADDAGCTIPLHDIGGAVAVFTTSGAVVDCSPAVDDLFAVGRERRAEWAQPLWNALVRVPEGEAAEWRPPGGSRLIGCTRYRLGGSRMVVVMREITEKREELAVRLQRQRMEAVARLVVMLVHDLRAPLASIVLNLDMLTGRLAEIPPDEAAASLHECSRAADRLRQTVDGLLDFVRIGPPIANELQVSEIVDHVLSLLRPVLRSGGHVVRVAVDPAAARVCGNGLALEQILVNLVVNAVEAAARAQVVIHTEPARGAAGQPMVRIVVSDDGPGIPLDSRERLFQPFFTTKPHNAGIGLSSARDAAEGIGGRLELDDSERGARFVVTVPAPPGEASA